MTRRSLYRLVSLLTALTALSVVLAGCGTPAKPTPQLRLMNIGSADIENLTVLFPEEEVEFGDVPAGTTTEYREVQIGVYGYAAYRYELDGEEITQPVLDWVGEEPLEGTRFTYTIDFDPSRPDLQRIQLLDVTQGE